MTDTARLNGRIMGRYSSVEAAELIEILASDLDEHGLATFWEELRDLVLSKAPLPPVEPKVIKARPMTDAECREFEKETMPFGKFVGRRVGDGDAGLIEYMRWLADQTFVDDLRRYLANETIARQE